MATDAETSFSPATAHPAVSVAPPIAGAPAAPAVTDAPTVPGFAVIWSRLAKARLSALVLATTAVGFVVAKPGPVAWMTLLWTCIGTGLAAASAAMLNQLAERRRDGQMKRTSGRPLPAGHTTPRTVFIAGVLTGYAGCALLAVAVNLPSAAFALANILLYVLLYTPLKPRTTFNTLVGAVAGAIPPMIGWVGATGSTAPGAWALFAILFVWQIPHFLSLAWMYRADYALGGFAMLPSLDASGRATARACLLSSLCLAPVGLLATMNGVAGYAYAGVAVVLALWLSWLSWRFLQLREDARARRLFLASLVYLPLLLGAMVADRGSVVPTAQRQGDTVIIQMPPQVGEEP